MADNFNPYQPNQDPFAPPAQDPYAPPAQDPYAPPAQDPYAQPAQAPDPYAPPAQDPYAPPTAAQDPYAQPNASYAQPNQGYAQPDPGYAQPTQGYQAYQPTAQPPMGGYTFPQRNIALAIVLSIVTCGIYAIIWFVKMVDELNLASDDREGRSGGTVFLLGLVTCGIYALIWMYKAGDQINNAQARRGMPQTGNGVIYLVLSLFGLGIVSYALIQNELNKIAAFDGAPAA